MGIISTLQEGITNVKDLIGDSPVNITNPLVAGAVGAVAGSALTGGVVATVSAVNKSRKKSKSKRKNTGKRTSKRRKTRKSVKQKKPYTAGKGKDRSTKRIRYTKNNQPYVILKSGKARFIKRSSVSRSRKRKGGRY